MDGDPMTLTPDKKLILRAICDPGSFLPRDHYNGQPYGESIQHWSMRAVLQVINEWLAGRTVVDLPEPDEDNLWQIGDVVTVEAEIKVHDGPSVWIDDRAFDLDEARKLAAALLAATNRAEQLDAEHNATQENTGQVTD
jgi:hypothetical protein